jgi:hypothetical protein
MINELKKEEADFGLQTQQHGEGCLIIGHLLKQVTSFSWELEGSFPSMTYVDDDTKGITSSV